MEFVDDFDIDVLPLVAVVVVEPLPSAGCIRHYEATNEIHFHENLHYSILN